MRDRIAAAAKINSRTMNAEIVARLQSSFEASDEMVLLKATHAYDQSLNTSLMREKADLQAQLAKKEAEIQILKQRLFLGTMDVPDTSQSAGDVLYILLDSNGYPIAWEEIYAYLDEIRRLSGKLPSKWETSIITPDVESSSQRAKQAVLITKKLRDVGISQAIGRVSRSSPPAESAGDIEDAKITAMKIPDSVQGDRAKVVLPKVDYETRDGTGQVVGAVKKPRKPASRSH